MRFVVSVVFCCAFLISVSSTTSLAGGSISFEDVVTRLAGQSPKLMVEVHAELSQSGQTISDIVCGGVRLGRHWKFLGVLRIPAFECQINGKQLVLEGNVGIYDSSGKEGAGPDTAMFVSLSEPSWSWK